MSIHTLTASLFVPLLSLGLCANRAAAQWTGCPGPQPTVIHAVATPATLSPAASIQTTWKPIVRGVEQPYTTGTAPPRDVLCPPRICVPQARMPFSQAGYSNPQRTYVLRPVIPVVPMPSHYYVGRGSLGQPKLYVNGQPIQNFFRYLLP